MSVQILTGDCREILRTLPDESVHCVVTSPPYWGLRDYGIIGQLGLEPTLGEHIKAMVTVFREVRRVMRPDASLWLNYGDCYATTPNGRIAAAIKAAGNDDRTFRDKPFSTIGPVTTDAPMRDGRSQNKGNVGSDGVRRNFSGQGYLKPKDLCMVPNRVAIALQDDGWWVRAECIWGKPNAMPDSSGRWRPATAHEKVWCLSKTGDMFYDAEAVKQTAAYANSGRSSAKKEDLAFDRKRNGDDGNAASFRAIVEKRLLRNYEPNPFQIWHLPTSAYSEAHFATFTPDLAEICIRAGCPEGGTVLDPFGGAGTTGLVAHRLHRDAILAELNPEYAEMARHRIDNDTPLVDLMNAYDGHGGSLKFTDK